MGARNLAGTIFNEMHKERKKWIEDAMLNYSIHEWDDSREYPRYVKQGFIHQYELSRQEIFGQQIGWEMSYLITSKDAEEKEERGKISNLDFGSTKKKKVVENNVNSNTGNHGKSQDLETSKPNEESEINTRQNFKKPNNNIAGLYPQASERKLTDSDLNSLSKDDLRTMRNEIFARYGHTFIKGSLIERYFLQQDWYTPKNVVATNLLTGIEKENIALIQSYE